MKERLEKEFNNYLNEKEGVPRMWKSEDALEWAKDIAQYFYNLALKDVKRESERRLNELNPIQGWFGDRPLRDINPRSFPRESELERIIDFIDQLSK